VNIKTLKLKKYLKDKNSYKVPSCHDPLSAKIIEKQGFKVSFIGGFALSSASLGYPDASIITEKELVDATKGICNQTKNPVVVDADTGFGGLANVYKTVKDLEQAGASAVILEDQVFPKRCALTKKINLLDLKNSEKRVKIAVKAAKESNKIFCTFKNGQIKTSKIIFATNGFLKSLGIKSSYNFPITLTASMTRSLTDDEFKSIGQPKEWGVLPVRPMGATIRMTKDKRILIRNTAEVYNPFRMSKFDLEKRSINQKIGIQKRFPQLPEDIIQSSWSGVVSRTRNSSQIFEKIDSNVFAAGCYNGSGIGVGTLFGEQIAIKASEENSTEIETIEARNKPTWLPPQPFLNLGVKTRLIYERLRARSEI